DAMNEDEDINIPSISNILTDIPAPTPEPPSTHIFSVPRQKEDFDPNQTRVAESLSNASVFNRDANPPQRRQNIEVTQQSQSQERGVETQTTFDDVEVTAPSRSKPRPSTPVAVPQPGEADVTRESPTTEAAKKL